MPTQKNEQTKKVVTYAVRQGMLWPMTHDQFNVVTNIIGELNKFGLINYGEAMAAAEEMRGNHRETKNPSRHSRNVRS